MEAVKYIRGVAARVEQRPTRTDMDVGVLGGAAALAELYVERPRLEVEVRRTS